jgi:hypothetical protein
MTTTHLFRIELCRLVEEKFPGVTAGMDGFVTNFLRSESDGFQLVHIFNIPEKDVDALLAYCQPLAQKHLLDGGDFVVCCAHNVEETEIYFRRDVENIIRVRA